MSSWHHSPPHHFEPGRVYMVTAGTYRKAHYFKAPERREYLQETVLDTLQENGWNAQAWAVLSNHYHFVAEASQEAKPLGPMLRDLHSQISRVANRQDDAPGRQVWFQYRETALTYEKSWLARLNYVQCNAVHHGLVLEATQYPYCSAAWFAREAAPGFYRTVTMMKTDRLNVEDDF